MSSAPDLIFDLKVIHGRHVRASKMILRGDAFSTVCHEDRSALIAEIDRMRENEAHLRVYAQRSLDSRGGALSAATWDMLLTNLAVAVLRLTGGDDHGEQG